MMGFAMIAIMLFHQPFITGFPFNCFFKIGNWGVEIFLLVSGFGIIHSLNRNTTKQFYINRIKRIVPTLIICECIKYTLAYLSPNGSALLPNSICLYCVSTYLWYIKAIFIYYLLSPLAYRLLQKYNICMIYIVTLILCNIACNISDAELVVWIFARFPIFLIGLILGIAPSVNINRIAMRLYAIIFIILLCTMHIYKYMHGIIEFLFLLPFIPCFIELLTHVMSELGIKRLTYIEWFGKLSLEIYITHEFVYGMVRYHINNNILPNYILFIVAFSSACIFAEFIYKLKNIIIDGTK